MTSNIFSHDDAVGITLSTATDDFDEVAFICRFATGMLGEHEVPEDDIIDELKEHQLEPSEENIEKVRQAIARQAAKANSAV